MYSTTLTVRQITLWEALRQAGSYPELSPPEGIETFPLLDFVKDMHKSGSGPVVIFPEVKLSSKRKETRKRFITENSFKTPSFKTHETTDCEL
jgi:hypothetical protein